MKLTRAGEATGALAITLALSGCAFFQSLPEPTALQDRLDAFPKELAALQSEVVILWDDHQIPFILAETDDDAAYALGLVHAHLRLAQMEFMRRMARGRLAEIVGPFATDIDESLRILDFARAAPAIEAALPEDTRRWLARFVDGINTYQELAPKRPHEFETLGLEPEPWTIADLIAMGRFAAIDVNWLFWFRLWSLRARGDWPELWSRLLGEHDLGGEGLAQLLAQTGRPGSNAFAVAGERSATGAALLANDPHLGLSLPNSWLIAGFRSPSYHVAGLMIPGLPFVAVGRNPDIAWGGTNLRAASSALYGLSGEDAIRASEQEIEVRWWFDRTVTLRDSSLGPIISDSPHLDSRDGETIALRWMGHGASDEFTAMLKVNRASDWESFLKAFESFAVSGQNMVYADRQGNIGKLMAVQLPRRSDGPPPDMILEPGADGADWSERLGAGDLPSLFNPPEGVVVSANDAPGATSIPIGYFFSPDDRVRRMSELLEGPVGVAEAMAIQQDVFAPSALALKDALIAAMEAFRFNDRASGAEWLFFDALRRWDGFYRIESRGAAAFEIFLRHFVEALYDGRMEWDELEALLSVANLVSHVSHDLAQLAPERLEPLLHDALRRSAAAFDGIADWGAMHRLELRHPLSNMPLIGHRYRFADVPTAGSRQTLFKTSHGLSDERHRTSYGANARFVADLGGIDENYILLLGGQDGWLNSSTFLDQLPLWSAGDYIRLPLSREGIEAGFTHRTVLSPGDGRSAEGDR